MKVSHTFFLALGMALAIDGRAGRFDSVGPCKNGATLANVASGPYRGRAFDLMAIGSLRRKHIALVSGESTWIQQLSGPSGPNKSYSNNETRAILFSTCKQGACTEDSLTGIFDPVSGAYGLVITESGASRELGTISALGRAALACLDERATISARAVEESIRKPGR